MPAYQTVSYTTTGVKASIALDTSVADFGVTVAATLVAGSVSYKMQYSLDPSTVSDANALWMDSPDMPAGTTSGAVSAIGSPITRVRFDIASISTGPLTVQALQATN